MTRGSAHIQVNGSLLNSTVPAMHQSVLGEVV
jgi:hypothetical protein